MKHRWILLLSSLGALALAVPACSSAATTPGTSSTGGTGGGVTSTGGAAGAPTGSGGTGGMPFCKPGTTEPCDCPTGGAGVATCDASGSAYGTCEGCNVAWSRRFDGAWSPAVRADDHVYLAVGTPSVPDFTGRAIRIAPSGDIVDDTQNTAILLPAITLGGAAIFAGSVPSMAAFGDIDVSGLPGLASVLVHADGSLGGLYGYPSANLGPPTWALDAFAPLATMSTGMGDDGRVAIITPGKEGSTGAEGRTVAALAADGALLWSRTIRATPWVIDDGYVAMAPQGNVIAVATFKGALDVGFGSEPSTVPATQANAYFVFYSATSTATYHRQLAGGPETSFDVVTAAADAGGNVVIVTGAFGRVDLGNGPQGAPDASNASLTKLAPDGNILWHRAIDAAGPVTVGPNGDLWVCGRLRPGGTVDGAPATVDGEMDILLSRYDASGTLLSHRQFGGPGADLCRSVAVGASGVPVIAGNYEISIDFGQGPLSAASGSNAFVARLGP